MPAPVRKAEVEIARTDGNLAIESDWQNEVHSRLAAYRARRRHLREPEGQTALPFSATGAADAPSAEPQFERPPVDWLPPAPAVQAPHARSRVERSARDARDNPVEIAIEQPIFDWSGAARQPASRGALAADGAQTLRPVASLEERRIAGLLDAAFLLFTFGGILALFWALGGRFTPTRLDAAVTLATLGLFYAQYFMLFTVFGGSTPGMMLRGLRVVGFDGDAPTPRQMLWRSFGYLISAGTLMLGFLWALCDEDHLCWQDRISQTYLTPAAAAENSLGSSARLASPGSALHGRPI